jgi:hypothetical protein
MLLSFFAVEAAWIGGMGKKNPVTRLVVVAEMAAIIMTVLLSTVASRHLTEDSTM